MEVLMKALHIYLLVLLLSSLSFAKKSKSVSYRIGEKEYKGYYADAGKGTPFVLLIHDWDGLTEYEVKRSDMLSELGYTVFAVDLFGKGVKAETIEERRRLTGELYSDRNKMRSLMAGALEAAKKQGASVSNGVAIGYCFGGAAALELARSGEDLRGFVTFHGGLETPEGQDVSKIKGKVLVLHGSADKSVTFDHFAGLAKELEAAKIDHEMIAYSGADHAFSVFGGQRYHKNADEKSWARFLGFLKETVGNN